MISAHKCKLCGCEFGSVQQNPGGVQYIRRAAKRVVYLPRRRAAAAPAPRSIQTVCLQEAIRRANNWRGPALRQMTTTQRRVPPADVLQQGKANTNLSPQECKQDY